MKKKKRLDRHRMREIQKRESRRADAAGALRHRKKKNLSQDAVLRTVDTGLYSDM